MTQRATEATRGGPSDVLSPNDLPRIQERLLESQEALADLLKRSANPLEEHALEADIEAARARRAALMEDLSRVLLRWLMDGGNIELTRGVALQSVRPAPVPVPHPLPRETSGEPPRAPAKLAALQGQGRAPSWANAHQALPQEVDLSPLSPLVAALEVAPTVPGNHGSFIPDELNLLTEAVSPNNLAVWRALPRAAQRVLVGLVTARARHIHD